MRSSLKARSARQRRHSDYSDFLGNTDERPDDGRGSRVVTGEMESNGGGEGITIHDNQSSNPCCDALRPDRVASESDAAPPAQQRARGLHGEKSDDSGIDDGRSRRDGTMAEFVL